MPELDFSLRATPFLCATALTLSTFAMQAHAVTLDILAGETVTFEGTANGVSKMTGDSTIAAGGRLITNDARITRQEADLHNKGTIEVKGRRYLILPVHTLTNSGAITIDDGSDFETYNGVLDNANDGTITNNGRVVASTVINNGDIENNGILNVRGTTPATPSGTGRVMNTGTLSVTDNGDAGLISLTGSEFTQTEGMLRVNSVMNFDTVQITGGALEGGGTIGGDVEVSDASIHASRSFDGNSDTLTFSDSLAVTGSSVLRFDLYAEWALEPLIHLKNGIDVGGPVTFAAGTVFDVNLFLNGWDANIAGRFDWDLVIADSFGFTDLDGLTFDYGSDPFNTDPRTSTTFNPAARYTTAIFDMADGRKSVRLSVEAIAPVPLPASGLLLLGGVLGLVKFGRRRTAS